MAWRRNEPELSVMTGLPVNEITPRINEMRNFKYPVVVEARGRNCKQSGRRVIAWKPVASSLPRAFPEKSAEEKQSLFQ